MLWRMHQERCKTNEQKEVMSMTNGKIALRVLGILIGAIVGLLIVYEAK